MEMQASAREEARRDVAEQQDYFASKREQTSQTQLNRLVAEYTKAIAAFVKYSVPESTAPTLIAAWARLKKIPSAAKQHAYLSEQIEMRVLGLGLTEHAISWSTGGKQRSNEELLEALGKASDRIRGVPGRRRRAADGSGGAARDAQVLEAA
eukprot:1626289-Pleurochrysis_carterae.AAC.9